MTANARVKKIREYLKLSQANFAKAIGVTQSKIADIEVGKGRVTPELARELERQYQANIRWILFDEEEMFLSSTDTTEDSDKLKVPVDYEQSGSCGTGTLVQDNQCPAYINLSKFWIRTGLKASLQDLVIIFASGDSMQPNINDGDMLLVDKTQIEPKNGVYLVRFYDELFVKRVQIMPHKIMLKSDNTNYDPIEIQKHDLDGVQLIGKVVWNGSKRNI